VGDLERRRAAGGSEELTAALRQPAGPLARLHEVGSVVEGVDQQVMNRGTAPASGARIDLPSLYESHWRSMVRLAVLLVDDVPTAEDVVQDAFVGLYRRGHALRDPAAAVAYLRSSVVNLSRSVLRHRHVVRRHLRVAEPDHVDGADFHAVLSEEHRQVLAALRELPNRQREVLVLRFWSGLSEAGIAETLGISTGSVKSSASRGMAKLSKLLVGGP
jgi:RNA polymerase sigma-70 factor (sigma-E family)